MKYWLPVLAWMAVIFIGSGPVGSTQTTSRFIGPFLRWFSPAVSDATIQRVQLVVRKGGHLTEYAILAALVWRARRKPQLNDQRPWNMREAVWCVAAATLYAVTDELHQSFIPGRLGSPWDVLIDAGGAVIGLGVIWWIGRLRGRWRASG